MDILLETLLLILATLIFYAIFTSLIYYWRESYVTVIILPLIYTFQFFFYGFLIIVAFHIIKYLMPLIVSFFPVL